MRKASKGDANSAWRKNPCIIREVGKREKKIRSKAWGKICPLRGTFFPLFSVVVSPLSHLIYQLLFIRVFLSAVSFPEPVVELLKAFDLPVSLNYLATLLLHLSLYSGQQSVLLFYLLCHLLGEIPLKS